MLSEKSQHERSSGNMRDSIARGSVALRGGSGQDGPGQICAVRGVCPAVGAGGRSDRVFAGETGIRITSGDSMLISGKSGVRLALAAGFVLAVAAATASPALAATAYVTNRANNTVSLITN